MRNRLWLIIPLLVWMGQWNTGIPDLPPVQETSCRAVWFLVEDLAALVVYQARRRMLWSPPCTRSRRRRRRGSRKPPFRHRPVSTTQEEEQEAQPQEARKAQGESVLDPHR